MGGNEPPWRQIVSRAAMVVFGLLLLAGSAGVFYFGYVMRDAHGGPGSDWWERRDGKFILGVASFLGVAGSFLLYAAVTKFPQDD
jgi:hypothetical protein